MDFLREAANTGGKTPVMWLQEICVKDGCGFPRYEEKDLRASISELPKFEVKAIVTNFDGKGMEHVATGVKSNKKDAKQEAALNMLFQLKITPKDLIEVKSNKGRSPFVAVSRENEMQSGTATSSPKPDVVMATPPSSSGTAEVSPFCVQELLALCETRNIPNPEFTDVKSEGPPHLKTFWVKCTVRPLNGSPIEVTESANQKKKAKNLSAASMLKMLQANGGAQSNLADLAKKVASNPDVSDNLVQRIVCKDKQRCSNLFSHSHHRFQNMFGQAMLALKERQMTSISVESDEPIKLLNQIASEENLDVSYIDVEERAMDGRSQCYIQIVYPPTISGQASVFIGEGITETGARRAAALNGLIFLKEVSTA